MAVKILDYKAVEKDLKSGRCRIVCPSEVRRPTANGIDSKDLITLSKWPIFIIMMLASVLSSVAFIIITSQLNPYLEVLTGASFVVVLLFAIILFAVGTVLYQIAYKKL